MDFGIQLPTTTESDKPFEYITQFVKECEQMGYKYLSYTDHFYVNTSTSRERDGGRLLDPLTLSAAMVHATEKMIIAPSIALIVQRGVVPLAKHLATMDMLTGGRMIAGIGPGSRDLEYQAVDIPFGERWGRFDDAARVLRSYLTPDSEQFSGKYYSTKDFFFEPYGVQKPRIPIWVGSWGSDAGMRRVARLGDGWMGSALNLTPERFGETKKALDALLPKYGKDPETFPNAVCTMQLFISDNASEYEGMGVREGEPPRQRIMVGSAEECADKLQRWDANGAKAIFLNPTRGDITQQAYDFMNRVASRLPQKATTA